MAGIGARVWGVLKFCLKAAAWLLAAAVVFAIADGFSKLEIAVGILFVWVIWLGYQLDQLREKTNAALYRLHQLHDGRRNFMDTDS